MSSGRPSKPSGNHTCPGAFTLSFSRLLLQTFPSLPKLQSSSPVFSLSTCYCFPLWWQNGSNYLPLPTTSTHLSGSVITHCACPSLITDNCPCSWGQPASPLMDLVTSPTLTQAHSPRKLPFSLLPHQCFLLFWISLISLKMCWFGFSY